MKSSEVGMSPGGDVGLCSRKRKRASDAGGRRWGMQSPQGCVGMSGA